MKTVDEVYNDYNIDTVEDLFDLSIMALDAFIEEIQKAEYSAGFTNGYESAGK